MPKNYRYYFCIFLNRHKKTFASGVSVWTPGRFGIIVKRIPVNPDPCEYCHRIHPEAKRKTHAWGAYAMHEYYSDNCSPFYFASGDTAEQAQHAVLGHYEIQVGQWSAVRRFDRSKPQSTIDIEVTDDVQTSTISTRGGT